MNALRAAIDNSAGEEIEIRLFLNEEGNLALSCNRPAKLYVSDELYGFTGECGPKYGTLN